MKTLKNILIIFITFLICILLISSYRSFIDQVAFWSSFDFILTEFFKGVWVLLQSPIIQTSLFLFLGIWLARNYLPKMLSLITEIKAGEFSAKLDTSKLLFDEISKETTTNTTIQQITSENDKNDNDNIDNLLNNMSTEIYWYLIKVHEKNITLEEHLNIFESEKVLPWAESSASLGYLTAFLTLFNNVLFSLLKPSNQKDDLQPSVMMARLVIKPFVFTFIKTKLNIN